MDIRVLLGNLMLKHHDLSQTPELEHERSNGKQYIVGRFRSYHGKIKIDARAALAPLLSEEPRYAACNPNKYLVC